MKLEYVQLLVDISMEVDLSLMSSKNEFVTVNKLISPFSITRSFLAYDCFKVPFNRQFYFFPYPA